MHKDRIGNVTDRVDVVTLHALVTQMRQDVSKGTGISKVAVLNIANIIEQCVGAPILTPISIKGANEADLLFPGSPNLRGAFNAGVAWVIQNWPGLPTLYFKAYANQEDQDGTDS